MARRPPGDRAEWEESGVALRVFVAPVSLAHVPEGASILRYAYPAADAMIADTHNYLHHLHVHLNEGVARPGKCAHLSRRGSRYVAVFSRVSSTGDDGDQLVTCIWRTGGVTSSIPSTGVPVALDNGDAGVFTLSANHLTLSASKLKKSVKPKKLVYAEDTETLIIPEEKLTLVNVDPVTAWMIQRMADEVGGIKHNIRVRPAIAPDAAYIEATETLLRLVHLLWPTVEDAYTDALATYLDDISAVVAREGICGLRLAYPSKPIPAHVTAEVCASLHVVSAKPQHCRASWVLHPAGAGAGQVNGGGASAPPPGPHYLVLGELVMHSRHVVVSSLPPLLTRVAAHYLSSVAFGAVGRLEEDVFIETVIVDHDDTVGGGEPTSPVDDPLFVLKQRRVPVKALLVAYRREGLIASAVLLPSLNRATGVGHLEVVANLKGLAVGLLEKGLFLPRSLALPLPPCVHRCYVATHDGRVVADTAAADDYMQPPYTAYIQYAEAQLRRCREVTLEFASPDPKDTTTYVVAGWRADVFCGGGSGDSSTPTGKNFVVAICDAGAEPVLSSVYCAAVAALPQ